jgi:hypothetical protein
MDAGGQTIELKPLRPLNSNRPNTITPGTENGYLMILTNGITDTSGNPRSPTRRSRRSAAASWPAPSRYRRRPD